LVWVHRVAKLPLLAEERRKKTKEKRKQKKEKRKEKMEKKKRKLVGQMITRIMNSPLRAQRCNTNPLHFIV
jgi:hypothetical protein